MTEDLRERVHEFLKELGRPAQMEEIYPYLQDDHELSGMDQTRGMRKLRTILNSSRSIAKRGVRRGAAYEYNPLYADDLENMERVERDIILMHLRNGGSLDNDEPYDEPTLKESRTAVTSVLNNLQCQGALWRGQNKTYLTEAFWDISISNRISTRFTHSAATGQLMDDMGNELERLYKPDTPLLDCDIPIPVRPSRSTAIEFAVAFTTHELKKLPIPKKENQA